MPSWNAWSKSACRLLHARYGALGVIGDDHALSHFITVGIDGELARRDRPAADRPRRPGPADLGSPAAAAARSAPAPRGLRVPRAPPAHAVLPGRPGPRPGGGVREPLPHGKGRRGRLHRRRRGPGRRLGGRRRRRHRKRPALRRRPPQGPLAGGLHGRLRADAEHGPRLHLRRSGPHRRPGAPGVRSDLALLVAPAANGAGPCGDRRCRRARHGFSGRSLASGLRTPGGCPGRRRAGAVRRRLGSVWGRSTPQSPGRCWQWR